MPVTCPKCAYVNPDNSTFCVSCGNKLEQTGQYNPTAISSSMPTFLSSPSSSSTPQSSNPSYSPSSQNLPSYPSTGPSYPSSSTNLPSYQPASNTGQVAPSAPPSTNSYPSSGQQWPSAFQPPPPPGPQIGTTQSMGSLRHAFAGYGTLVTHHSWLLPGNSAHERAVFEGIKDKMIQRNVPQLAINSARLTERGLMMEERDYLIAHRGASTVFIYTAPAGQDLYISRATTVLPTISNIRVAILGLLLLIMFIGFLQSPTNLAYASLTGGLSFGTILGFICYTLSYPLLFFFIVLLIRSFITWLLERDFWKILRNSLLNDFQLDDISLLEHLTDDAAHGAVEQAGLDASKITPPYFGYQHTRRIRVV